MPTLKTRLSLTALSLALLFSCAAPVVQPGQIKAAIDTNKVAALQEKINNDGTLLDALSADPKAFLAKEGIILPADQQVKVLEVGEKLYLVLDDRSLQLLHPELNKAVEPQNESAKKFTAIRAKAAADPAFKSELLKNTAQTLIKEGFPESVATQFEVVDYQPNVNVLMVASEGAEISRGTPKPGDWNLNLLKFYFDKEYSLPSVFYPVTKNLLNKYAGSAVFKKGESITSTQEQLIELLSNEFETAITSACSTTATLVSPKFCVGFFSVIKDSNIVNNPFEEFLTDPDSRNPEQFVLNKILNIEQKFKFLRDAEAKIPQLIQEEKDPKNKTKTLTHLQLMQTQANELLLLIRSSLSEYDQNRSTVTQSKSGTEAILKTIKTLIAERQS